MITGIRTSRVSNGCPAYTLNTLPVRLFPQFLPKRVPCL